MTQLIMAESLRRGEEEGGGQTGGEKKDTT